MRVGFIGLNAMGRSMVISLLNKGFSVKVYKHLDNSTVEAVPPGAATVSTAVEAAQETDVIVTMLKDDAEVLEVILGPEGIIQGLSTVQTVIDCSTISPKTSKQIHHALLEHNVDFLDAPFTGSRNTAENRTLVFMVGGEFAVMDTMRPLLETMGAKVVYMGDSGSGSSAKLAHNTIAAINLLGFVEGMAVATKAGLSPERFVEVVLAGSASSKQAETKSDKIISRDFSVQWSLESMLHDLLLADEMTDSYQLPMPLQKAAISLFQIGLSKGLGDQDMSAIIQCYEDWMQTQVEVKEPTGAERRRNKRLHLNIPLMLSVHQWEQEGSFLGQNIEGSLYDLSESGIQIISSFPLSMDMFIVIHFPQEADLPPITARVIRIGNHNGSFSYGCMLSGLAPHVRLKIEDYIAIYPYISGDSDFMMD